MIRPCLLLVLAANLGLSGCATPPLQDAVNYGNLKRVDELLDAGEPVDAVYFKMTALCRAAFLGKTDIVRELLRRGADPDGGGGVSPMAYAFNSDKKDAIIQLLVDAGASVDEEFLGRPMAASTLKALRNAYALQHRPHIKTNASDAASLTPPPAAPAAPPVMQSDVDRATTLRPERPDDFALVIGIEKYSRLPEARFAENDADAMKSHLLALGYPERNIILLKGGQATRGALQGYVEEWLPRNAKPESQVFVYFSGHGSPDLKTGDAYIVPWDGDAMFLKSTAYPLKALYASLSRLKAKRVLVALDSCFSGAGGRSVLASGARPLVSHVDDTSAPAGVTVLSAASGDEITATLDEQGHGAFTYYLLKAMNDGKLTARTAYAELKPRVQDEAHRQNREQTPLLLGDDATF
ncbi:MAG: caspase family protein [Elusimicrobiota bacterium]